ncbi:MAG: AEC family transporter [Lachnospiraceae bacterium]|nr:AEC family transporter [Lachnospiraceae bacterium]
MTFSTVFYQMLALLILIGAGYIAAKTGMMDEHTSSKMSAMILNIFNPMLAISSASGAVGQIPLSQMGQVALIAVAMFLLFIVIGMILSPFFSKDTFQKKIFELMFVFSNLGFMGIPVVSSVLGSEYVVYVTEFMMVYNIFFYTYGITMMDGKFSAASLKKLLTPSNLLVFSSIFILVFSIQLPDFVNTAVTYLGNVTSPMAMMTIGYALSKASLKDIFTDGKLYLFTFIKLLVIPLALLPVLKLLPIPSDLIPLCMIMFGMPVGNMPLILGNERGIDGTTCSAGIIMTTLFCLVTIPLLMAIV